MIPEDFFENKTKSALDKAEETILKLLRKVKQSAEKLINGGDVNLDELQAELDKIWDTFNKDQRAEIDKYLPDAYLMGIRQADKEFGGDLKPGSFSNAPLVGKPVFPESISEVARQRLKDLPNHLTMYGVFQQAAYDDIQNTRVPVVRSTMDKIRDLVVEASKEQYRTADSLTRRDLSESIMRRLADESIDGIQYAGGRTMKLDSYAEVVARSQTGNAARQAHLNRLQEYGKDLIVISVHYPCSDLCLPYQGNIYSISGDSEYPPLNEAISGGLYHANCKHSQSGWTQGQGTPDEKLSDEENLKRYEAQKMQRYNERQIKAWKRREAVALSKQERAKAKAKIRQWQKRQREHLSDNQYLRRRYDREQI